MPINYLIKINVSYKLECISNCGYSIIQSEWFKFVETEIFKISKAPDGQGPVLTNYKPKL